MESQEQTSSKNTETDSNDLKRLAEGKPASVSTKTVANAAFLQQQLIAEQDGRKEERFVWSLVVLMLFNVIVVDGLDWHMIWLLFLELVFLFVFGRICQVDYIYEETQRAIDTIARMRTGLSDREKNRAD